MPGLINASTAARGELRLMIVPPLPPLPTGPGSGSAMLMGVNAALKLDPSISAMVASKLVAVIAVLVADTWGPVPFMMTGPEVARFGLGGYYNVLVLIETRLHNLRNQMLQHAFKTGSDGCGQMLLCSAYL